MWNSLDGWIEVMELQSHRQRSYPQMGRMRRPPLQPAPASRCVAGGKPPRPDTSRSEAGAPKRPRCAGSSPCMRHSSWISPLAIITETVEQDTSLSAARLADRAASATSSQSSR